MSHASSTAGIQFKSLFLTYKASLGLWLRCSTCDHIKLQSISANSGRPFRSLDRFALLVLLVLLLLSRSVTSTAAQLLCRPILSGRTISLVQPALRSYLYGDLPLLLALLRLCFGVFRPGWGAFDEAVPVAVLRI